MHMCAWVPVCACMYAHVSICVPVLVCAHVCVCQRVGSSSSRLLPLLPSPDFLIEIASCLLQIGIWSSANPITVLQSSPLCDLEMANTDKAKDIPEPTEDFCALSVSMLIILSASPSTKCLFLL